MSEKIQTADLVNRKDNSQVKFKHYTDIPTPDDRLNVVQSGCRFKANPGYQTKVNIYDHYIIHYLTSGKGIYVIDGQTYPVQQGDLFLIPPYKFTYYIADEIDPYTYYWVGFDGLDALNLLNLTDFINQPVVSDRGINLTPHFKSLYELEGNPISLKYGLMGHLYTILSKLMHSGKKNEPKQNRYYIESLEYITTHYGNPDLSVQEVANHVGLTRSHLHRIFHKAINNSISYSILSVRLSKAVSLLSNSQLSIKEIAYQTGFESPAYFSKQFKRQFKCTPSEYRHSLG
ncbi:AraC-like DNA-binding protein [Streptococcus rupicaprae]|uniref:AraC-like DNA-binding protein n=1 Tax=Streptococcus rupicaprae TaxID=759619 RepID=A0ABV2FGH4_9STRE